MKENTKYHNYRFVGKINVDEIEPWFDFDKAKPWDEMEVPWVLENRVRREILIILSDGPKSFDEIYHRLNFSPKPLIISKDEYEPKVKYNWTKETLENHLMDLEWYNLIRKDGEKYEITIPILNTEHIQDIENYITNIAKKWVQIIKEIKEEAEQKFSEIEHEKSPLFSVLIEKTVEKLYELMKKENILPNIPNIKTLWAEQLRKQKYEEWLSENF
ncbi:MAG: hypothetical protein ACTSVV_00935 [Promethearchaeota archaeon]